MDALNRRLMGMVRKQRDVQSLIDSFTDEQRKSSGAQYIIEENKTLAYLIKTDPNMKYHVDETLKQML